MNKRKKYIIMCIITMLCISACGTKEETANNTVENKEDIIVCETIKDFIEKSEQGIACRLDIEKAEEQKKEAYWFEECDIVYDGKVYYSEKNKECTYKYLLNLEGRYYGAENDVRHIALTNEKYTWEDFLWYYWGNQQYDEDGYGIYQEGAGYWGQMNLDGIVCEIMNEIIDAPEDIPVCETMEDFMEKSEQGIECRLDIEKVREHHRNTYLIEDYDIIYDGNVYYSKKNKETTYKYFIDLTGIYDSETGSVRRVVLANEKYTWEDLCWYYREIQQYEEDGHGTYEDRAKEWLTMEQEGLVYEIIWESIEDVAVCETLEEFKEKSEQGIKCRLSIEKAKEEYGAATWLEKYDIVYDGEVYYSEKNKDYTYKYLIDLTGIYDSEKSTSRRIVLANEKYTWEDLCIVYGIPQFDEGVVSNENAEKFSIMIQENNMYEVLVEFIKTK